MHLTDYCQWLIISQKNYTCTNFADHKKDLSHDKVNRFLRDAKCTPRMIWEKAKEDVITSENGYILFDDTVVDKNSSFKMELVRMQYSGNAHGTIKGIGVVTCVYVNPELNKYWIIDMRIFAPEEDGKTKLDHLSEMLSHTLEHKKLPFKTVLMDSWYAVKWVILEIEKMGKKYYCPLKKNRLVDDTGTPEGGKKKYKQIADLEWSEENLQRGKEIHINKFPKDHTVQLFQVQVSTNRTEYIITNDDTHPTTDDTRSECAIRWKIEQLHREAKQLTGLEKCQCRKSRIQRNHILSSWLVWLQIRKVASEMKLTMYQLKNSLLDNYLLSELKNPSIVFA